MPRKKNLDLADALGEEIDVTEDEAIDANRMSRGVETSITMTPLAVPATPAVMAPITLTFEQLQTLLASKSESGSNADLVAAFSQAVTNAREPIPENKFSPGISALNPLGEREHPRPGLKCDVTLGTQDPQTKQLRDTYPYEADDLTVYEQIALNTLQPWTGVIERLDGAKMKVAVVPAYNAIDDSIEKLVIVIPADVTGKGSTIKNMLPGICNIVEQITGHNYAKLSNDDLAWFMAEHRKKNYVAVREAVAA